MTLTPEDWLALATEFTLQRSDSLTGLDQITLQWRGPDSWAICCNRNCLTRGRTWVWEPQPSSRTDAFIKKTRFATKEEAHAVYQKWAAKEARRRAKNER